jgi:acyl dehydratase
MSGQSLIPPNFNELVGKETEPVTIEVEKSAVRRLVEAIGDPNPIFYEEQAASEIGGIVAPPTFFTTLRSGGLPEPEFNFGRVSVAAGREVEFFKPIRPGQRLTSTNKYVDAFERQGRSGRVLYYVNEITITDETGEKVAVVRRTMARSAGRQE